MFQHVTEVQHEFADRGIKFLIFFSFLTRVTNENPSQGEFADIKFDKKLHYSTRKFTKIAEVNIGTCLLFHDRNRTQTLKKQ